MTYARFLAITAAMPPTAERPQLSTTARMAINFGPLLLFFGASKLGKALHERGQAHSVEAWTADGELAGGLYGVRLGAAFFGMIWAGLPAYLQAKRGSHIVITTIMFNFIAAGVLNFFLVGALKPKGSMDPATANFPAATHLPTFEDMAGLLGFEKMFRAAPANVSFFLALVACVFAQHVGVAQVGPSQFGGQHCGATHVVGGFRLRLGGLGGRGEHGRSASVLHFVLGQWQHLHERHECGFL